MLGSKEIEADFEFTWTVLTDFFSQKRIQRTLDAIHETEVSGWEKWWQVELALYLSDHDDVADWNKVSEAQTRSKEGAALRSFFVAGIYPSIPKVEVHDYVERRLGELEIEWDMMDTKFISGTPYGVTMF